VTTVSISLTTRTD